jgi:hypothetical protein
MTTPHPASYAETFWTPDPESAGRSRIADFGRRIARHRGVEVGPDPTKRCPAPAGSPAPPSTTPTICLSTTSASPGSRGPTLR